jgi:hypothetical protein
MIKISAHTTISPVQSSPAKHHQRLPQSRQHTEFPHQLPLEPTLALTIRRPSPSYTTSVSLRPNLSSVLRHLLLHCKTPIARACLGSKNSKKHLTNTIHGRIR